MAMQNYTTKCDKNLQTQEEKAIWKAIELVENLGADEKLTEAVAKLSEAGNIISEHIDKVLIHCIGSDKRIHYCEPHSYQTICGVRVTRKKILSQDYEIYYSCCECDYRVD